MFGGSVNMWNFRRQSELTPETLGLWDTRYGTFETGGWCGTVNPEMTRRLEAQGHDVDSEPLQYIRSGTYADYQAWQAGQQGGEG